jgi:hypothetical protein
MCKVLDWSNEPLYFCSKCCIKTVQMCLIDLLIHFKFINVHFPQKNSMVFFHCIATVNWTVQLALYSLQLAPSFSILFLLNCIVG